MLNKCLFAAILAVFVGFPLTATAQDETFSPYVYIGVGPMFWFYANDQVKGAAIGTGLQGRLGLQVTDLVGIEGRYSAGGEDSLKGVDVSLEGAGSLLLTLSSEIGNHHRVGAYLGASSGKMKFSNGPYSVEDSDSGPSFGAFFNLAINEDVYAYFDYGTYLLKSDYVVQGVSLGLGVSF